MKRSGIKLTAAEREVLTLSMRLLTNEEIAKCLNMSVFQVKALIRRVSAKLGAHSRYIAHVYAFRRGYVSLDEVFSADELAELLGGLEPGALKTVSQALFRKAGGGITPTTDDGILYMNKGQVRLLTNGERDVLILVGQGLTNAEIAERLSLSIGRVRNILISACSKLGARSRGDAFLFALRQRAIALNDVMSVYDILLYLAPLKAEFLEKMVQVLRDELEHDHFRIAEQRNPNAHSSVNIDSTQSLFVASR